MLQWRTILCNCSRVQSTTYDSSNVYHLPSCNSKTWYYDEIKFTARIKALSSQCEYSSIFAHILLFFHSWVLENEVYKNVQNVQTCCQWWRFLATNVWWVEKLAGRLRVEKPSDLEMLSALAASWVFFFTRWKRVFLKQTIRIIFTNICSKGELRSNEKARSAVYFYLLSGSSSRSFWWCYFLCCQIQDSVPWSTDYFLGLCFLSSHTWTKLLN